MAEQLPIELILVRQLAGYLATPVFVIDDAARLVYYNEAAEELLGRRFDDTTLMGQDEWLSAFAPREVDGRPFTPADDPLLSSLADGRERHRSMAITGLDGHDRRIEATLMPLVGQAGRVLGAVAIFWPVDR
jgi:PAS domain-containing protein